MDKSIVEEETNTSILLENVFPIISEIKDKSVTDVEVAFKPVERENNVMQNDKIKDEKKKCTDCETVFQQNAVENLDAEKIEENNFHFASQLINTKTETSKETESDEEKKKIANSITVVSDFSDLKIENKDLAEMYNQNMNLSFTSSSSSSELQSPNQASGAEKFSINQQNSFESSSDVVPRKNSPVPASPPSNIDVENETSSIEHLSSLNNFDSNAGFRRVKSDRSSKVSEPSHISYRSSRNQSAKNRPRSDPKNEKISIYLDKWYKELKGQVLVEFEKSKSQIYHDQEKKFLEEKEKQNTEVVKLRREIELLRETVKLNEKNMLKKDAALDNITKAFDKQREKNELQRVMMDWKFKRLENAKEAFTSKLAEKYYQHRLKMKSFFNWQCFLISRHKAKVEKACKKKAEEVCYDLATNYENRIKKLEEELNSSRMEIEKYRIEMAKNEENMRKALMRGVCALNMEAMSIFNENQTSPNPHLDENQIVNNYQKSDFFTSCMPTLKSASSLNDLSISRKHEGEKDLARKVKSYCESSLSAKNKNTDIGVHSAVAKARLQLLNSNNKHSADTNPNFEQESEPSVSNQKVYSNNKVFDELTEHYFVPKKIGSKHSNVKSKIGSLPKSNSAMNTGQIGSTLPPYRSVVIEKHTNNDQKNEEVLVKTMATKVKYSPPGQPANVLNTVITT